MRSLINIRGGKAGRGLAVKALASSALLAAALMASPASAAVVVNPDGSVTTSGGGGGSWTVNFDGFGGEPPSVIAGLTADITFTFISAVGGTYTFGYDITNTSSAPITDSRISLFGFTTDPNFASASVTGVFDTVGSGNVPNFGNVEFCGKDGGGTANCAGGGAGGVGFGDTGSGQFTLNFSGSPTSITLDDFVVRYQSIAGAGNVTSAIGRPTDPVPEPGTWAMMLMGFGAAGYAMRRSRRQRGELLQLA